MKKNVKFRKLIWEEINNPRGSFTEWHSDIVGKYDIYTVYYMLEYREDKDVKVYIAETSYEDEKLDLLFNAKSMSLAKEFATAHYSKYF